LPISGKKRPPGRFFYVKFFAKPGIDVAERPPELMPAPDASVHPGAVSVARPLLRGGSSV
jgi:hypothetical protein